VISTTCGRNAISIRYASHRHASRHVTVKTQCLRHDAKKEAQLKRMRLWKPPHTGLSHDADVRFCLFRLMSWCLSWRSWCAAALKEHYISGPSMSLINKVYRNTQLRTTQKGKCNNFLQSSGMEIPFWCDVCMRDRVYRQTHISFGQTCAASQLASNINNKYFILPVSLPHAEFLTIFSTTRRIVPSTRQITMSALCEMSLYIALKAWKPERDVHRYATAP
jgi:hypothetical protein